MPFSIGITHAVSQTVMVSNLTFVTFLADSYLSVSVANTIITLRSLAPPQFWSIQQCLCLLSCCAWF